MLLTNNFPEQIRAISADILHFPARSSRQTGRNDVETCSSDHRQCTAPSAIPCRSMQINFPDAMGEMIFEFDEIMQPVNDLETRVNR